MKIQHLVHKSKNLYNPYNRGENTLIATLATIKRKRKIEPLKITSLALKILCPNMKVVSRIKAGRIIFLPAPMPIAARYFYSIRWLYTSIQGTNFSTNALHKRKIFISLADELNAIMKHRGYALKLKRDYIKTIKAARINSRYRKRYASWHKKASNRRKNWFRGRPFFSSMQRSKQKKRK